MDATGFATGHTNGLIHASLGRAQRTQGSITPSESAL